MSIPLPSRPEPVQIGLEEYDWNTFRPAMGYTADQLRARDLEIARVVLEVVKSVCETEKAKWPFESACTVAIEHCVSSIRALEFHHE